MVFVPVNVLPPPFSDVKPDTPVQHRVKQNTGTIVLLVAESEVAVTEPLLNETPEIVLVPLKDAPEPLSDVKPEMAAQSNGVNWSKSFYLRQLPASCRFSDAPLRLPCGTS